MENKNQNTATPITGATLGDIRVYLNSMGDLYSTTWADDGELYMGEDDSQGWDDEGVVVQAEWYKFEALSVSKVSGDDPFSLKGTTINKMPEYRWRDEDWQTNMWKATGITFVDGALYLFVHRCIYNVVTPTSRDLAFDNSIIKSIDYGKTWTPKPSLDKPMFPGQLFGAPFFVEYGKNRSHTAHDADKYIYAISNDGYWNNGGSLRLGRVRRDRIGNLDAADWQFYTGGDGMTDENWSGKLNQAEIILNVPEELGEPSIQYVWPLGRYVMTAFHHSDLKSGLGKVIWSFYESPTPWGPWTKFYTRVYEPEGLYNPVVPPKFISEDGLKMVVFTSGGGYTKDGSSDYRLCVIPMTLTTTPYKQGEVNNPGFEYGNLDHWAVRGVAAAVGDGINGGKYAVKVTEQGSCVYQEVRGLKPNTVYELTGWGRVVSPGDEMEIGVCEFGGVEQKAVITEMQYAQKTIRFATSISHNSARVYFLKSSGSGDCFGDGMVIREVGPDDSLIVNPEFEIGTRGWKGDISFTAGPANSHNGNFAGMTSGTMYQEIKGLKPYTTYTLKAWGKAGPGDVAAIGIKGFFEGCGDIYKTITGEKYVQASITFTTGSISEAEKAASFAPGSTIRPGTTGVVYFSRFAGTGWVCADSFELAERD